MVRLHREIVASHFSLRTPERKSSSPRWPRPDHSPRAPTDGASRPPPAERALVVGNRRAADRNPCPDKRRPITASSFWHVPIEDSSRRRGQTGVRKAALPDAALKQNVQICVVTHNDSRIALIPLAGQLAGSAPAAGR